MATSAHLLFIDDHALFRTGFGLVLAGGLDDVAIHEAASLDEALRLSVTPTMIMLDVQLDGLSDLEGMASLRRRVTSGRVQLHLEGRAPRDHASSRGGPTSARRAGAHRLRARRTVEAIAPDASPMRSA